MSVSLAVVAFLAISWLAYHADQYASQVSVARECDKQGLSRVAVVFGEYARTHDERLPPRDEWFATLDAVQDRDPVRLECEGSDLPYQWDLRWAGEPVVQPRKTAIAWCPRGGHRDRVVVLTIGPDGLGSEIVSDSELLRLYHRGGPGRPDLDGSPGD